jgi:hypothetical protein
MTTQLKQVLAQLESLGNERVRAQNRRNGAGDRQFGVPLGEVRKVADGFKADHALALVL